MTIMFIITIAVLLLLFGFSFKLTLGGKNSLSAEIGDSTDGFTEVSCRKCGGNNFGIRTTELTPLGVVRRTLTESVCQMCGSISYMTYNTFREKHEEHNE